MCIYSFNTNAIFYQSWSKDSIWLNLVNHHGSHVILDKQSIMNNQSTNANDKLHVLQLVLYKENNANKSIFSLKPLSHTAWAKLNP